MTLNLIDTFIDNLFSKKGEEINSQTTSDAGEKLYLGMTPEVIEHVRSTVGSFPIEQGGVLLGKRNDYIVTKFIFDENATTSGGAYDPAVDVINAALTQANEEGLHFLGFLHSHPFGCRRLSGFIDRENGIGDLSYLEKLFQAMPYLDKILTPIVQIEPNGDMEIIPYIAYKDDVENYELATLEIIPETNMEVESEVVTIDHSRLAGSIDVELMNHSTIVCVGVGGANQIMEKLARCGAGKITAIDFDTVDASNLTTQGFYQTDIGSAKVDALGRHINNINPNIEYQGIQADFMKLPNRELKKIMKSADLLLMMTDDFHCQAFGNKLAVRYSIPTVFAMMYDKARAAEISFSIPGVTPACHRCCTPSRFKAYEEGYENDVTSNGSTVFHTEYLNSVIGLLSLAILHRDLEGLEMAGWFGREFDRNLVQLRLSPNYGTDKKSLYYDTNGVNPRNITFDSVWQKVSPENGEDGEDGEVDCPDCGGHGDLEFSSFLGRIDHSAHKAKLFLDQILRTFHFDELKDYFSKSSSNEEHGEHS